MLTRTKLRIAMTTVVRHMAFAYMAVMMVAMVVCAPRMAMAGEHIDPDGYVGSYMEQNKLGSDSNQMLQNNNFQTYESGEVLPGFDQIGSVMTGLMIGFVPVLFVIKFAGRAMLSITHSGDDKGNIDIPNFFKTAEERSADPGRGGAKEGTSWYISMGKDFLRYFGVAVAIWLVFAAIIGAINLVMGLNGAPTADSSGFMDQFNKTTT